MIKIHYFCACRTREEHERLCVTSLFTLERELHAGAEPCPQQKGEQGGGEELKQLGTGSLCRCKSQDSVVLTLFRCLPEVLILLLLAPYGQRNAHQAYFCKVGALETFEEKRRSCFYV